MSEMIMAWVVGPLVLALLCHGIGLIFSLVARKPLGSTVSLAVGFLVMGIGGSLSTFSTITAPWTAAAFGLIALAGTLLALVRFRSHLRFDALPTAAGLLSYVGFSLPVVGSGSPSWAGWVKLDDDATFLAVTERLMTVGRTVPSPITSTYERVIQTMFAGDTGHFVYPVGAFIPFGVAAKLTGVEKAWLFQPYLSFSAALVAMLFALMLRPHVQRRALLVGMSAVSSMASTIYSYVMWGGIKEIVILTPLVLLAFALPAAPESEGRRTRALVSGLAIAGLIAIGGTAGLGYVLPIVGVGLLMALWKRNRRRFFFAMGAAGALGALGTWFLKSADPSVAHLFVPIVGDMGNLTKPLSFGQLAGIWPSQDFRLDPVAEPVTWGLILVVAALAGAGVVFSWNRSRWGLPALVVSCLAVVASSSLWGGIWLTGKAIAIASPCLLLAASIGAAELWRSLGENGRPETPKPGARRWVAGLAAIAGAGVLVSDAFTYRNVWLAPHAQQAELRTIGERFAGQGPALMTEYSVFGARYFLRALGAEAASELRVHLIPMRTGTEVPKGFAADIDLFEPGIINPFPLLVLRRSPNASRPPPNYDLAWSGAHYEVWKRNPGKTVLATMPIGSIFYPAMTPKCDEVASFVAKRTDADRILAALRDKVTIVDFSAGALPAGWQAPARYSGGVHFSGPGTFTRKLTVEAPGSYGLWIAGSVPGRLTVLVDGREVASARTTFEGNPFLTNPLGRVELTAGEHIVTVDYATPLALPGSDAPGDFGPIYVSTQTASDARIEEISAERIPELCAQNVDWVALARY